MKDAVWFSSVSGILTQWFASAFPPSFMMQFPLTYYNCIQIYWSLYTNGLILLNLLVTDEISPNTEGLSALYKCCKEMLGKEFKNPMLFGREAPVSREEVENFPGSKQNTMADRKAEGFIYNLPEAKISAECLS